MSKQIPEIRFKEFTDEWEQRKLGDLLKTESSKQYITEANVGDYPVIQQGDKSILGYSDKTPFSNFNNVVLFGDHTLSLFKPITPFLVATDGVKILSSDNLEGNFLYAFLQKYKPESQGYKRHFTILKNETGNFPINTEEQQKIGAFFKSLDDTISLHQDAIQRQQDLKKAMLQKLFPINGGTIPTVRFSPFTEEWEQRKVGEFLEESKIPGSDGSIAKKLTVKLWGKGVIPKEEKYKGSASTNYYIRKQGQFIYGKLDFLHQAFGIIPKELDGYESTLDSPAFDILQGLNAKYFLEYVLRKEFYLFQGTIANGSRRAKRIHSDTFFNMPIVLPSIEEQEKIGKFFDTLDHTIALHQQALEKIKLLKKSLLQKMFVNESKI